MSRQDTLKWLFSKGLADCKVVQSVNCTGTCQLHSLLKKQSQNPKSAERKQRFPLAQETNSASVAWLAGWLSKSWYGFSSNVLEYGKSSHIESPLLWFIVFYRSIIQRKSWELCFSRLRVDMISWYKTPEFRILCTVNAPSC